MTGTLEYINRILYGEQHRGGIERLVAKNQVWTATGFVPTPVDVTKLFGPDVDQYSGPADWNVAIKNGAKFAIIKMMDGTLPSQYGAQNWAAAKAAGLPRIAYCWLYASKNISGTAQAKAWWDALKNDPPELYVAVDFEWTNWLGQPSNPTYSDLYGVNEAYKSVSGGVSLKVYTAPGYWSQYGSTDPYFENLLDWIAQYPSQFPANPPLPLVPSKTFSLWQFTPSADAALVGIPASQELAVDMNYYIKDGTYGTADQFKAQFGLGDSNPAPTPPPNPTPIPTPDPIPTTPQIHVAEGLPSELEITPSVNGVLEYQDLKTLAQARGWRTAMNAGAGGVDQGDRIHFKIYGLSAFQGQIFSPIDPNWQAIYIDQAGNASLVKPDSIYTAIPYSNVAVFANGTLNENLDNVAVASRNIIALKNGKLLWRVIEGVEGQSGYTKLQAAQYAYSLGVDWAVICDSGHPCNFYNSETGEFYSSYGEPVQFAVGFKANSNTGGSMSGTTGQTVVATVTGPKNMSIRDQENTSGNTLFSLTPNMSVIGILDVKTPGVEAWVQITSFPAHPEYVGKWCAVVYNSQVFATYSPTGQTTSSTAPTKVDITMPDGSVYEATQFNKIA